MKLNIVKSSIALLILIWVLFYFKCNNKSTIENDFKDKYKIDSIVKENKFLKDSIKSIDSLNIFLQIKADSLKKDIVSIKKQKNKIIYKYKDSSNIIDNFNVDQLDNFFTNRYGYINGDSLIPLQKHQAISGAKDIVSKDSLMLEHDLLNQVNSNLENIVNYQDSSIKNYIKKDSVYNKIILNDSINYSLLNKHSINLENKLQTEKKKAKTIKKISAILIIIALLL